MRAQTTQTSDATARLLVGGVRLLQVYIRLHQPAPSQILIHKAHYTQNTRTPKDLIRYTDIFKVEEHDEFLVELTKLQQWTRQSK